MNTELGIRINSTGSGRRGQEHSGSSRRQQHQQKLKALIAALDANNLMEATMAYRVLLEFSPELEATNFGRIGLALRHMNVSLAKRVIQEIYGQSQAIFKQKTNVSVQPKLAQRAVRENFGVLVDCSA
jgi:hypothetical protein